ncbi:hypothetical protein F4778DRAFT_346707 [Xylariomycetidae sp. FL2044]|nr:hypothetical protein F4778DRAFT_346707 [Xylariomycetidae sp. FL2044]
MFAILATNPILVLITVSHPLISAILPPGLCVVSDGLPRAAALGSACVVWRTRTRFTGPMHANGGKLIPEQQPLMISGRCLFASRAVHYCLDVPSRDALGEHGGGQHLYGHGHTCGVYRLRPPWSICSTVGCVKIRMSGPESTLCYGST